VSDIVYRGNTEAPPPPSEPTRIDVPVSEAQREERAPRVPFSERVNRKLAREHGGEGISSKDESALRALSPKRRPNETVEIDFSDQTDKAGTISLKDATKGLSALHMQEMGRRAGDLVGMHELDDETAQKAGQMVADMGRFPSEAGPKVRMGTIIETPDGWKAQQHFRDGMSVREQMADAGEKPLSVRRAAEALTRFREVRESALQADLTAAAEQAEAQRMQQSGQQPSATQTQSAPSSPPQKPAAQPQRPDPLEQEKAQLQRERALAQQHAEYARLSAEERKALESVRAFDDWAVKVPELSDNAAWASLVTRAQHGDRGAIERLQKYQQARQNRDAWERHFRTANESRVNHQIALEKQAQQQNAHALAQWGDQQNKVFDSWLENNHPHYATETGKRQLKDTVRQMIRERTGWDDARIGAEWNAGRWRSAAEQSFLAESAMHKLTRESLQRHPRVPKPQPQSPGVARSRASDVEDVRSLQRAVSGAKGERAALMAAVRLQQAKRRGR
jgi:hypothetical protein